MIDFAEPCVFDKQSPPPGLCPPPLVAQERGPLLPKLRGQFAEFLRYGSLKRLGMLYQSTCVGFGYGRARGLFPGTARPPRQSDKPRQLPRSVTTRWLRTIDLIPIAYAFRPRLRGRLTLRGLALRRNPWTFGGSVSHTPCRYSCQHSHSPYLHGPSRVPLHRPRRRSATTPVKESAASVGGLSPGTSSAQDGLSRPVSYYAFFKGWLLLSQPPGCHGLPTSFPT